ncbi:BNR-4 repeat-containing protein [Micromonospora sp. NPDC047740]|uniref:BNR-4 repeat-containing protein n=1 Tax=Micromonospora sp. NPDC047740 TaxID=3364254 RepID=UPI00371FE7D4
MSHRRIGKPDLAAVAPARRTLLRRVLAEWSTLSVAALLIATVATVPGQALAGAAQAEPPAATPVPPERLTVMTPATAVAARSDRRPVAGGLYDARANTTFISWSGQYEDNFVQAYNHVTGAWSAPVRVGEGGNDSHNYPTMVQADDGHLLVFRGLHNKELWVARSARPHSIDGPWTDTIIPEGFGATYPMPFKTASGEIFVFIRETARDFDRSYPTDTRPIKYVRSTDNGLTWQTSAELTGDRWAIAPTTRADNMNEVYIGQLRYEPPRNGRPEQVQIVYTLAGGGPEGHLHDRYHKNIYHLSFSPNDLRFRAADGHDLGTSVDDAEQEQHLKVAETPLQTTNPRSPDYISLVGSSFDGTPFVLWMQIDTEGVLRDYTGVWTAGGWDTREIATGVRVRDMYQAGPLSWRVYATIEGSKNGISTFLLYGGTQWKPESVIPTAKAVQRIEVLNGFRDPARILATGASSDRDVSVADGDIYVIGRAVGPKPCEDSTDGC